ncbi:protocadherin Fat 4 [Fundulus diaphanus]
MDGLALRRICVALVVSVWVDVVAGSAIGNTVINCNAVSEIKTLGPVDEGYSGDVEQVTGIEPGTIVTLEYDLFPDHLQFLELSFTPGETTATIRTKTPLDADFLATTDRTLYYALVCGNANKYRNARRLKVNDINDNSPVFDEKFYSTSVSEIHSVNAEVLRVRAVDADSSPEFSLLTYSYEPQTEDFSLTNSGAFLLMRRLNYNVVSKYNFIVTARDKDGRNDTTSVEITVDDFDNLNPYFSHSLYQAVIPENQNGALGEITPEAIKAQDGDTGINVTVTYSITSVSPAKYRTSFDINSATGVLSVVTSFDREEMDSSSISVNIRAAQTDDSLKTADAVVSVTVEDVNDNAPEFDQSDYTVSLLENSPAETVVFKAVVTDLDQGGFVGTLQILPETTFFSISSDGTVRVMNPEVLDREVTEKFVFQIEAKETNEPKHSATAQVAINLLDENDNSPIFSSSKYEGSVFGNQTVGMLVVKVEAEDADAGRNGEIQYSIEFGNSDGYFSLNSSTGEIRLAKTIPLEENRVLEFPLYITARDGGSISRSASAQVFVRAPGNSKPQFVQKLYQAAVQEEQDPGTLVLKVSFLAIPPDSVTFEVIKEADKFSISPAGEVKTKVKLDGDEAPHNYSVEISISDGVTRDTAVVEVQVTDINDNSPVFASSSVTKPVPEDAEVGSNITQVPATDKDSGFNKEIRYSLRGGEGRFFIDPVSGMVSLAAELDRETTAEYELLVVAEDQGRPARSATATLLLQVTDINDNVPKFSEPQYQLEVLETEPVGTSLLTLSAEDPDEGVNGRVTYSISQQSPSSEPSVFELEASSGILKLVQPLNYSEVKVFTLSVQASDGGTPSLVGNGSVVVKVKDVNNNPPKFSQEIYNVAVFENLAGGASILTLEVTDIDEGGFSNGHFLYTSDIFEINKQGVVSLKRDTALDRETQDSYMLQVVAVDQATDGLSATAQLNIAVLDYNDNTPQFPAIPYPLHFPEGEYSKEKPGEIFTILPTDADIGLNGKVTVSLMSPHPFFSFREDGMLLAVGSLDRESTEMYDLVLKASDNGSPQRENITTIRVSLTDVNDNRPEFSSSIYERSILLKDAEEGKLLLTLSATDRDIGNNSLITYSFSEGDSSFLALNHQTGEVTLTSDLADVTKDITLLLMAVATDHGSPPLNSTARVAVNIRVVSLEDGVAFQRASYNFSLPENQLKGETVGRVHASSGSDLYEISYGLLTHTDVFSITSDGAILTTEELDKEEQEWYILEVEAVDTRIPPTSALALVRIQVEDVNESPMFSSEDYEALVFSIAPYKTPVIQVKAVDHDVGDNSALVYSLSADSSSFDVEPSSGLVYVVSAADLGGQTVTLEVKATDPKGLHAKATIKVIVQDSASSSDVTIISLNQPANFVERKVPELEKSLGKVLGWVVNIIQVWSSDGEETRTLRASPRTLVSFVAIDGGKAISAEEVTKRLQSESADVKAELALLFGDGLHFDVETGSPSSTSNQALVIALGVLLALSLVGLIVAVVFVVRFKKSGKQKDPDQENLHISRQAEGYTNYNYQMDSNTPQQSNVNRESRAEDREKAQWDRRADEGTSNKASNGMALKGHINSQSNESHTSAL